MPTWLMKSEPGEYSITDLEGDTSSLWYGVRNYLARNYMRDLMRVGDKVLFYHSSCPELGIYGIATVIEPSHETHKNLETKGLKMWRDINPSTSSSVALPDPTQFESGKYFDLKATAEKPIWYAVIVEHMTTLAHPITLTALRTIPELATMKLLAPGNRLSITPVSEEESEIIFKLIS